jgi:hypothetical protein
MSKLILEYCLDGYLPFIRFHRPLHQEHFRAKRILLCVKKMRQNKDLKPFSDHIQSVEALERNDVSKLSRLALNFGGGGGLFFG